MTAVSMRGSVRAVAPNAGGTARVCGIVAPTVRRTTARTADGSATRWGRRRRAAFSSFVSFSGSKYVRNNDRNTSLSGAAKPGDADAADVSDSAAEAKTNALVKGLLLAFLATQNRSFFASKAFVETVMAFYEAGYSLDAIKNAVTFSTISLGSMNQPVMLDVLLAWTTCVYVTLDEVDEVDEVDEADEADGGEKTPKGSENQAVLGLRNIAKMWIQKYREEGMTFQGLLMQQNVQEMSQVGGAGEFVRVMQQNARLVLLTLEMVDFARNGPSAAASESSVIDFRAPGFVTGMLEMPEDPLEEEDRIGCRPLAVRLLLAFNAAALGYLVGARTFVETAGHMYVCGWTADDVYLALEEEEFEQGGGFQVRVARPPGGTSVSQALFSRWISIVYMTMATLGVAHPKAAQSEGWAWVCSLQKGATSSGGLSSVDATASSFDVGGSLEAHGVFDFVVHTLQEKAESGSDEEVDLDAPPKDEVEGFTFNYEDPDLPRISSFALVLKQQVSLVEMTSQMVMPRLGGR